MSFSSVSLSVGVLLLVASARASAVPFPMGRCYAAACSSSAYDAAWSPAPTPTAVCIRLTPVASCAADASPYACCARFSRRLDKIVLPVRPECRAGAAALAVTMDGRLLQGGVYADSYDGGAAAELRITNLGLAGNRTHTLCLAAKPGGGGGSGGGSGSGGNCSAPRDVLAAARAIAFFDPARHDCCPTCRLPDVCW
jgi:hypothetical protein